MYFRRMCDYLKPWRNRQSRRNVSEKWKNDPKKHVLNSHLKTLNNNYILIPIFFLSCPLFLVHYFVNFVNIKKKNQALLLIFKGHSKRQTLISKKIFETIKQTFKIHILSWNFQAAIFIIYLKKEFSHRK